MRKSFIHFLKAKRFVRKFGIKSQKEWYEWVKALKPEEIPSDPSKHYKYEWVCWKDWLNDKHLNRKREFLAFDEARVIVRQAGLTTQKEWLVWARIHKPINIPSNPRLYYKRQWVSWRDWLITSESEEGEKMRKTIKIKW